MVRRCLLGNWVSGFFIGTERNWNGNWNGNFSSYAEPASVDGTQIERIERIRTDFFRNNVALLTQNPLTQYFALEGSLFLQEKIR